jgi:DNA polymerase-3 subunit gamma/tau
MTASSFLDRDDDRQGIEMPNDTANRVSQPAGPQFASTSSLYRKYRPNSFDAAELVGQEHVVRTLRNAISLGRIAHAYLFSGPRGTGKTTTARLLAKAINCLAADPSDRPCNRCAHCLSINSGASPDIIEIDAASNRGIDDIRELRERSRFAPTQLASKVYIIDEAHQITGAAANAFLKTLEEPPPHTRFILATTDPEELLPTIVSRCQRFEFRRVGVDDMVKRLRSVAKLEQINITDDALHLIARNATGSLRDALGLLEQLAIRSASPGAGADGTNAISVDDVRKSLGQSRSERVESLAEALADRDTAGALRLVQNAIDEGEDARQLNQQLAVYLRMLLLERAGGNADVDERARALAGRFSLLMLARLAKRFSEIDFNIKHSPYPHLPLEVALVEMTAASDLQQPRDSFALSLAEEQRAPNPSAKVSLRDRVRNQDVPRHQAPTTNREPPRQEPAQITPIRPLPDREPATAPVAGDRAEEFDVAQIADLWPSVRADVKALNRRIEALLSEVDPVAISGNHITLAVPYPFHRDKLNSDDVRETVAGVLSRRLSKTVSIGCILRGEVSPVASQLEPAPRAQGSQEPELSGPSEAESRDISRLRAAKNIFDAEEIGPSDLGIALEESLGN